MSKFELKMPKMGESITEGTIINWLVNEGDTFEEGDIILIDNAGAYGRVMACEYNMRKVPKEIFFELYKYEKNE